MDRSARMGDSIGDLAIGATTAHSFLNRVKQTIDQLDDSLLNAVVDRLAQAWADGATVYVMGNGGSASTASHFACDLGKYTISEGKRRFRVIGLTDNVPLMSAWGNDRGFDSIFAEQMKPWVHPGDVLVGFSVHGGSGSGDAGPWSQNLVQAISLARERGATVIGFSGFDGGAMAEMADICVTVPALVAALGTPIVESVHVVLHHFVVHALREHVARA